MTVSARTPSALAAALRDIQAPVRGHLERVPGEIRRIVTADVPLVQEVGDHLLSMKGKLLRPTLVLLSAEVEGRTQPERAVTGAAIVELLHLATLIHDDAVDHSVLRRGMPTVNALFSHQVSVIMGDFLYSRVMRELVALGDIELMRVVSNASDAMTLGEMRQLAAFDALAFTEDDYERLIRAKTAALFVAACSVGALSGAPQHRQALARYGERLGMAFQVADDLLDYTETAAMTGKPSGLDLREHKVTLPLISALRQMTPASRARVEALFAMPEPDEASVSDVIALVREAGGLEYARQRAEQFAQEAEEAIAGLPHGPARTALYDAIGYAVDRRW
jgi:octaprenyl-diphosphate synthase